MPKELDGIKILTNERVSKFDPKEQQFSSEELFKLMRFKPGDDAMKFMNCIQCHIYGNNTPEGYVVKDAKLSPNKKKLLCQFANQDRSGHQK